MTQGPIKGTTQAVSVENALASWSTPPDWVMKLAEACDRPGASQVTVAEDVGYSSPVINAVLRNRYDGNLAKVEQAVRGALMADTVMCPIVGEISSDVCMRHQNRAKRKLVPTSTMRVRLHKACRETCQHSKIRGGANAQSEPH